MATGYGRDLMCTARGLVTGRVEGGRALLVHAIERRLSTPRGSLTGGDEESVYGFDLAAYVGAVGPEIAQAALPALVRNEILKDDRIASVAVTVSRSDSADGATLTLALDVTPADSTAYFALTLAVLDAGVVLLGGSL
jgi:hypothetical protein